MVFRHAFLLYQQRGREMSTVRYWAARIVRALISRLQAAVAPMVRLWFLWSCPGLKCQGRGQCIALTSRLRPTDGGYVSLGSGVVISRGVEITAQRGSVSIGDSTFIGPWTTIVARSSVDIGCNVLVAERVTIRDQDHRIHSGDSVHISCAGFDVASIIIGDGAWIGAGAVILKGVTIGRGAVVAANAVVTRSVGEREIVGGVPAKSLGYRRQRRD